MRSADSSANRRDAHRQLFARDAPRESDGKRASEARPLCEPPARGGCSRRVNPVCAVF